MSKIKATIEVTTRRTFDVVIEGAEDEWPSRTAQRIQEAVSIDIDEEIVRFNRVEWEQYD